MQTLEFNGKAYEVDEDEFLVDAGQWDEDFAEGMAARNGITGRLSDSHWNVLKFIRSFFLETGTCPMVYKTCKTFNLHSSELARLFPTGYRRGACKLAGLCYLADDLYLTTSRAATGSVPLEERVYRVTVGGYLIDSAEWDEDWARFKMHEMKAHDSIGEKHFEIIRYMRAEFARTRKVPTVYETCSANGIDMEDLDKLFPDGYHRGAVKIAGLRSFKI